MWFKNSQKRIFLDYASITPLDPEVFDAMKPYLTRRFHNPSALYKEGVDVKDVVKKSRKSIASGLQVSSDEIIFTTSGTESINLAILGLVKGGDHVVTSEIEHTGVLEACKEAERRGVEVTYLKVSEDGLINPEDIKKSLKENTVLVTIHYVNNEIGVVQPIQKISRIVKKFRGQKKNAPFIHADASQAPIYFDCSLERLGVDMLTLDSIKMHGPRGMGLLARKQHVKLSPIIFGGGQEFGLRSGTENTAAIVGFAKAFDKTDKLRDAENDRLLKIRDYCIENILKTFPDSKLNGEKSERSPHVVNICFPGIDAEFAVIKLDKEGVLCSFASACKTLSEDSVSHVVKALSTNCGSSSLRFSFGRETRKTDIDYLIKSLKKVIK